MNFERVMDKEGCRGQSDDGERLVEWYAFNNMIIGGTLFPHRNIHKLTWTSPNGWDQKQIDHLMVNSMWCRSLLNVGVKRGADASSDHHLVTADSEQLDQTNTPPLDDISRLQDPRAKNAFALQLRNQFKALSSIDEQDFDETSKTCLE